MEFKTPLILILIPLLIAFLIWRRGQAKEPAFIFSSTRVASRAGSSWKARFAFLPWALRVAALALLVLALAGPRKVSIDSKISTEGLDIVLALDVSGSMAAEDFIINGKRQNRLDIICIKQAFVILYRE